MQAAFELTSQTLRPITSRWRQVFCVVEDNYRDRSVADEVSDGVFKHAGVKIRLGTQPDWLTTALPEDKEWRIEWYKFYYGLDLAHAFNVTRKESYRRAWERLVESWIAQMPVGCDSSDVAARRIQNWIYAWNAFARGGADFAFAFEERLVGSLAEQVSHLRANLTVERNHRTLELYALFIAALALPELDRDHLLDFALTELHRNLLSDVRPDGVQREQSTHYHMTALRSFLGARENANRFALTFPRSYDERLEKACEFLLHVQRPDGRIPALSDADSGSYSDLLKLAAAIFERADFLYAATAGARGEAPAATFQSFPDGGYYIQRSGWGNGPATYHAEKYLIFDCGPLGDGGHGHYDSLSIEVAANGQPLIIDPGRFTYTEDDAQWRRYFKGTAAHNTVCVDDLDQVPYRSGKPKSEIAESRLLERRTTANCDMLCGEVRSPAYEAIHTRRIFFVDGAYWLVIDSLRGLLPHKYDLRFHLSPAAWNRCQRIATKHNTGIRTPEMALLFERHREPVISRGWVSPSYGVKEPAPVVSVVSTGAANTDFYTLIAPLKPDSLLPWFEVEAGSVRVFREDGAQ